MKSRWHNVKDDWSILEEPSCTYKIYVGGNVNTAKEAVRRFTFNEGLSTSVKENSMIYTGGAEAGVEIMVENYPRYPRCKEELFDIAKRMAIYVSEECCQVSCMIVGDNKTTWLSRRPEVD